jgi:hypothetical protein
MRHGRTVAAGSRRDKRRGPRKRAASIDNGRAAQKNPITFLFSGGVRYRMVSIDRSRADKLAARQPGLAPNSFLP